MVRCLGSIIAGGIAGTPVPRKWCFRAVLRERAGASRKFLEVLTTFRSTFCRYLFRMMFAAAHLSRIEPGRPFVGFRANRVASAGSRCQRCELFLGSVVFSLSAKGATTRLPIPHPPPESEIARSEQYCHAAPDPAGLLCLEHQDSRSMQCRPVGR
jgi:hypothetical protein